MILEITQDIQNLTFLVAKIIMFILPLIIFVVLLTLAERRIIGLIQLRRGPSFLGIFGLLHPIADTIKLLFKELITPEQSNKTLFLLAPIVTFTLSMASWAVIPFSEQHFFTSINVGILYLLATSSLGVYGIIIAGWASNSKYAFLGAVRSAAQMISYEISIGLIIITVALTCGSLNLIDIIESQKSRPLWLELLMIPPAIMFFISAIAETNRLPFDLPEAEAELVAGYNVEYSSIAFAMFFLGEYANMTIVSAMTAILFLGGYLPPFGIKALEIIPGFVWLAMKVCFLLFCFLWIRATLPRYRYDQLMRIGWKTFLPLNLLWLTLVAGSLLFLS